MNFFLKFIEKNRTKKIEAKVLARYIELAGLIRNGEMVNKDKEGRARAWVAEQEKLLLRGSFWRDRTIQAAFIAGFFTLIAAIFAIYFSR